MSYTYLITGATSDVGRALIERLLQNAPADTLVLAQGCGDLEKLADRGGEKLLAQLRTGSIEFDVDDDTLQVGDVLSASLPQLGYTAMVRVADIITQSQDSGTTRTIRLGTPSWHKT